MYQVMRAMINHSVPDIISQQEEEIKKLRKELREQTLWTGDLQRLISNAENRHDHTRAVATRMAYRIAISKHRGTPMDEGEEKALIDEYLRIALVRDGRYVDRDEVDEAQENIFNGEAEYLFDAATDVIQDVNSESGE